MALPAVRCACGHEAVHRATYFCVVLCFRYLRSSVFAFLGVAEGEEGGTAKLMAQVVVCGFISDEECCAFFFLQV